MNPRNHPRVIWSRIKTRWPFLIWLLAVFAFTLLLVSHREGTSFMGVAETTYHEVQSLERGRILSLPLIPGERVDAGDVVATLDLSGLAAERDLVGYQSAIAQNELRADLVKTERQLRQALLNNKSDAQKLEMASESEAAELKVIEAEIKRIQDLIANRLPNATDGLATLQTRLAVITKNATFYPQLIAQHQESTLWLESELKKITAEIEALAHAPDTSPAEKVLTLRLAEAELKSPANGRITDVYKHQGEVVQPGEAVARLSGISSQRIIGFIPELLVNNVQLGQTFFVHSIADGEIATKATVTSFSPQIVELSGQASLISTRLVRGRHVILELEEGQALIPGQLVALKQFVDIKDQLNSMRSRAKAEPAP